MDLYTLGDICKSGGTVFAKISGRPKGLRDRLIRMSVCFGMCLGGFVQRLRLPTLRTYPSMHASVMWSMVVSMAWR